MRTLLIFLSIGLVFTLIQCSNGSPIKSTSSESEEDDSVEKNDRNNLKIVSDSDETTTKSNAPEIQGEESSEEQRAFLEVPASKAEESNNPGDELDENDEQPNFINKEYGRILLDIDEK